ncbi:TrmH family RNA methyltransferase [Pseudobacteriovorax antillogorgiicola]|uniref:tRNA (guanosine(18)-2'-O)-methyltransferase n=1 Tax=Pseudobacteriovorax antillogorgiicola TaxID=1513793 RepID=A0A1Y6CKC8_9BACT|nr:RNA methyltransferase [Pseudobacteriovorax antillogorgiicola]TCS45880.1 tRNA (guanosine-2'-O-)-methyltransferase [Pseudobacteriovorax antillogorgiicola]SMF71233.1 tRNA (guanosine-2'-O-)-methyltransferase [Pseudobacteriovorax antillogorgiicola]
MTDTIPLTRYGYPADAWRLLAPRLTDKRREKMDFVASHRTKKVRLVLQDIHDPHNISACLRSAEAFGVLDIDIVNLYQKFAKPSTVSRGSYNWLKMHRYTSIPDIIQDLRSNGYKIAAGYPSPDNLKLNEIPVDQGVAVVFGNEHRGVAPEWDEHVDYKFTIPMVGMVESLNISVSAALTMYQLTQRSRALLGDAAYHLSEQEKNDLLSDWVCQHARSYEKELARLRNQS